MSELNTPYFELLLDTVGPALKSLTIGTGAAFIGSRDTIVKLEIDETLDDVIQMKIWGDVDLTFDTEIQGSEADSSWISFASSKSIKLSDTDGNKTIYAKLRDNVLNEGAAVSALVTLDTVVPTVAIISGPSPKKISKIATKDTSEFTFQSSENFVEYKVCVVADTSATESTGVVIGTANGSENMQGIKIADGEFFDANTTISCKIKGADLEAASPGDGKKVVKIFVKDLSGNWSN